MSLKLRQDVKPVNADFMGFSFYIHIILRQGVLRCFANKQMNTNAGLTCVHLTDQKPYPTGS